MMLVHKPQSIFPTSPAHTHRRVPSAPVVVQPTRTPGLLSLSKPQRPSPKPHLPSQQRHNLKVAQKSTKSTPVARAHTLAPEIADKKVPVTPPRGRSHAKHPRSPSPSLRGKHGRQPSPPQLPTPQQTPSLAEASTIKAHLFNPFSSVHTPPPSPTKPARRQQLPSPPLSPMPTRAIPVPQPSAPSTHNMAYSDPLPLDRPFRLVDDMDDTDDNAPHTPPRRLSFIGGPYSMPLPGRTFGKHQRRSSDIFPMSDEDSTSSSTGSEFNAGLFKKYNLNKTSSAFFSTPPPRSRQSSPSYEMSSSETRLEREANEKAGYFASSIFQNSPGPEELPDPMLL